MDTFEMLQYQVKQEHEQLEKLLGDINDEILQKPLFGTDDTTVGKRFAHIIEAEYRMAGYLFASNDDLDNFSVDDTSVTDLIKKSQISMKRHLLTLQNLSSDDLNKMWKSKKSGNSYEYKYLIWHFIEHIATHRGQLSTAIRLLKKEMN